MVITLCLFIIPGTGFAGKPIQTKQPVIVLDPGHGGSDKGLVSVSGLQEKDITLKLALKTVQHLETRYNVLLTRSTDAALSARERIFVANKSQADLFISIHLNHSTRASGYAYYFTPPETRDNQQPDTIITWKFQPLVHQLESKQAAQSFYKIFSNGKKAIPFFSQGAPVIILEGAVMPAILIEPLSISILSQVPDKMETILDGTAALIAESIDLYLKKR